MSLLPYILERELCPRRQYFDPENFYEAQGPIALLNAGEWPWRQLASSGVGTTIKNDKNQFQINLDVQHFTPDEISVKTADGFIVVEGKHEEKQDEHGYVSRQFVRRYALPEGCEEANVQSRLSSDGVLTVQVPRQTPAVAGERVVPIQQTGPVKKQIQSSKI